MKYILNIFFILLFNNLISNNLVNINIVFKNPPQQNVSIETYYKGWFPRKDIILENNSLNLSFEIPQLEFFKVSFSKNEFIALILLPEENVNITVDMENKIQSIDITGSYNTKIMYEQEKKLQKLQYKIDSLTNIYNNLSTEQKLEKKDIFKNKIDSMNMNKGTIIFDFIKNNQTSPACLFFIEKFDISTNIQVYDFVSNNLKNAYPQNFIINNFYEKVETYKRNAIGQKIADIKLPNANGDTIGLYPLIGDITIIDFWASWCGPCRKENPNKVSIYNKFKDRGLTFYSISLDNNKNSWINVIKSDNLTWEKHVSELNGWGSNTAKYFGITSIPSNIIINSNGEIIGKNIRGKELENFIEQNLKK